MWKKLDLMIILNNIFLVCKVAMSSAQSTNSPLSLLWFSHSAVMCMYTLYILIPARIFPFPIPPVFCITSCP